MAFAGTKGAVVEAEATAGDEDQLLMDKMRLLETDRKSYFEQTQQQLRENRDVIKQLQQENTDLKAMLGASRRGASTVQQMESSNIEKMTNATRLRRDKLRDEEQRLRRKLETELQRLNEVDVLSQPLLTPEAPLARKIRQLEARLDKSLIKFNEAVSIRKTYEQIVARLREERVGFDNQLAAIERTLKAKDYDYQELLKMSHAANHAKEVAKRELQKFKAAFDEERRAKDRLLAERKAFVQAKVEQTQRMEKKERGLRSEEAEFERARAAAEADDMTRRQAQLAMANQRGSFFDGGAGPNPPDEQASQYELAFRRIREATGVSDVQEVLQRFLSQEETHRGLQNMVREAEARREHLRTENSELSAKLEELRYSGSGQLGTRRIIEEFEVHLAETANQTTAHVDRAEQLQRLLINVKAGVEHLMQKLTPIDVNIVSPPMADDTVVEILKVAEQKLSKVADEIVPTELAVAPVAADGEMVASPPPVNNVRVRLGREDVEDVDDEPHAVADDADDDAVLKRDQIKKISSNAVAREMKKIRRRRKDTM